LGDGEESWVFVIYDNEAEFRAWASTADWMITPRDLGQWNLAWKLGDVVNAVRAELPGGWRSEWYTDDESIDYYRARREYTLRLRQTSQAEAARLAQIYLADHAWARAALRIATNARVHKPDGSTLPAAYIRAGDVITLRDLIPDSDETIHVREVDVSAETVSKSNLDLWEAGRVVNLERALKVGDELGGHIVSGHVDGVAEVIAVEDEGDSTRVTLRAPDALARYVAPKGSVALNGVSLTVNEVDGCDFGINFIPHTKEVTTWGRVALGDRVNLEIDTLARYVARLREWG